MKKAIITLSLICAGLLATSNIGDLVFAQDTTKNINKSNNVEVQVINKLNKEMIDDGKKLIEDIDKRLKKLDDISDKDLEKSDAEFRRLVGDHIVLEKEGDHEFRKILRKLDKELNIERKSPEK